jgi:IMP dehydrogenase
MDGKLGRVADVMTTAPVFVSVRDTAAKAAAALREHRLPVVAVLDDGRLVGVVGPLDLIDQRPFRPVSELMTRGVVPATPDLSLLQAHALFVSQGREVLPVVHGGQPAGYLTLSALLRAVSHQTDPLTGLPWAAALRTWAVDALIHRREVAIVFVDLDNFREVNKVLGHVAGDAVLRSVAGLLQGCTDPVTDVLCRYGGDEFAVATTRGDGEAQALAARIQQTVSVPVSGGSRHVTVTVGFAGGRRHEERAAGHAAATVDDLLTLASQASTQAKVSLDGTVRRAAWHREGAQPSEARVQLVDVHMESHDGRSSARVRLRLGTREVVGVSTDPNLTHTAGPRVLVAEATLRALHRLLGDQPLYTLEDVLDSLSASLPLVVAVVSGRRGGSRGPERYIGGATAGDLPQAVCKAVLDALNRPLARALGALLEAQVATTAR